MTWIPLLLADASPSLRILVLKHLLHKSEDYKELKELRKIQNEEPMIKNLIQLQRNDGSWSATSLGISSPGGDIQTTSQQLVKLSYLGFSHESNIVQRAVEFIFSHQNDDGSWPLAHSKKEGELEGYDMMPLQTIIPLEGIAAIGHSQDKRAERAFEWLLKKRLDDGAWPVGISNGVYGGIAGYRSIAHSHWGCRSTTVGALNCFSYHPSRKRSNEAKRALDLILGCETMAEHNLGFVISRLIGLEKARGFITYYPRLDPAHILSLCVQIEASSEDKRVKSLIDFIDRIKGKNGLWECKLHPQATRWLTYDILKSLLRIKDDVDWISNEPRTPYQEYSKKEKRF